MSRQAFARILVFCIVASALTPSADAQTTGIREVSASPRSLIPLQTRLRYTTMIVLPEDEEILDVICGDRDFWVISATHNIAHIKPAKERETAAQIASHEEKKRAIADWIAEFGTPQQQARHAAGVLPMQEVLEAMADQAFAAGDSFERYPFDGAAASSSVSGNCRSTRRWL